VLVGRERAGEIDVVENPRGVVEFPEGTSTWGTTRRIVLFSHTPRDDWNPENTFIEICLRGAPFPPGRYVRGAWGRSNSSTDDIYKKTAVLSGGEKAG